MIALIITVLSLAYLALGVFAVAATSLFGADWDITGDKFMSGLLVLIWPALVATMLFGGIFILLGLIAQKVAQKIEGK